MLSNLNICFIKYLFDLKFNVEKCMVMQIGLSNPKNQYSFGGESLRLCGQWERSWSDF